MITLLKIGYDYYLVKSAKQAAMVINGMAGVIKLRRDYGDHPMKLDRYYPDEHQDEIAMVTIQKHQLTAHKGDSITVDCDPNSTALVRMKGRP